MSSVCWQLDEAQMGSVIEGDTGSLSTLADSERWQVVEKGTLVAGERTTNCDIERKVQ